MADEQDSCHGFLRFVCLRSLYHTGGRISPHFFSDARNGNRELLARRVNLCCACRKEKFRMDVKDILHDLRVEKRTVAERAGGKGLCLTAGGVPLGERRDDAEPGNAQAALRDF